MAFVAKIGRPQEEVAGVGNGGEFVTVCSKKTFRGDGTNGKRQGKPTCGGLDIYSAGSKNHQERAGGRTGSRGRRAGSGLRGDVRSPRAPVHFHVPAPMALRYV